MIDKLFDTWLALLIPLAIYGFWEIEVGDKNKRYTYLCIWLTGCFSYILYQIWT